MTKNIRLRIFRIMLISQSKIPDVSAIRKLSDESSLTKHMHTPIAMTTQILNLALSLFARSLGFGLRSSLSRRLREIWSDRDTPTYLLISTLIILLGLSQFIP